MCQVPGIILADMSKCEPAAALSTTQTKGLWYAVDYQSADGVKGMMVYADSRQEPPVLTLPLNVTGWATTTPWSATSVWRPSSGGGCRYGRWRAFPCAQTFLTPMAEAGARSYQ